MPSSPSSPAACAQLSRSCSMVSAMDTGLGTQLSWTLATFFDRRAHWHTWSAGERYDDAHTHLRRTLDMFDALSDHSGRARTLLALNWIFDRQARSADALTHTRQAFELYRDTGDRLGQASALNAIGWSGARLGEPTAVDSCRRAVAMYQEIGDRYGEAASWDSLGYAHHRLGDQNQAVTCYWQALKLHRTVGDRYDEAYVLIHIGEAHADAGDPDLAGEAWRAALAILTELDHPDADAVRTRLHAGSD